MKINCLILIFALAISGIILLYKMYKSGKFFSAFFITAIQGIAALFAVNLISGITNIYLGINYASVIISAVSGTCGVIFLLICKLFLIF